MVLGMSGNTTNLFLLSLQQLQQGTQRSVGFYLNNNYCFIIHSTAGQNANYPKENEGQKE